MALFDRNIAAGQLIASAVNEAQQRVPTMIAPPVPYFRPEKPVFELDPMTQGTYIGGPPAQGSSLGPAANATTPMTSSTGARNAAAVPVAGVVPTQAAPPDSGLSGLMGAGRSLLQGGRMAGLFGDVPYGSTLAPLWEAPTPAIGLNTILSGQGPGSVAGGIDAAVNAGLGGSGGLFGTAGGAGPAAALGETAASIGGAGSSAATAAAPFSVGAVLPFAGFTAGAFGLQALERSGREADLQELRDWATRAEAGDEYAMDVLANDVRLQEARNPYYGGQVATLAEQWGLPMVSGAMGVTPAQHRAAVEELYVPGMGYWGQRTQV